MAANRINDRRVSESQLEGLLGRAFNICDSASHKPDGERAAKRLEQKRFSTRSVTCRYSGRGVQPIDFLSVSLSEEIRLRKAKELRTPFLNAQMVLLVHLVLQLGKTIRCLDITSYLDWERGASCSGFAGLLGGGFEPNDIVRQGVEGANSKPQWVLPTVRGLLTAGLVHPLIARLLSESHRPLNKNPSWRCLLCCQASNRSCESKRPTF